MRGWDKGGKGKGREGGDRLRKDGVKEGGIRKEEFGWRMKGKGLRSEGME